jgi:ArsR family transcriptional regulator
VIVDGRKLTWDGLGRALEPYEGWQFRLLIEEPVARRHIDVLHFQPMADRLTVLPCCSPISQSALSGDEAVQLAAILKALADPARIRLLSLIQDQPDGEACVCHLTEPLGLGQPTVSHHLKKLADAGFLTFERRGKWVYYRVVPDALAAVRDMFAPRPRRPAQGAGRSA